MIIDFTPLWALLLAIAVFLYVLLDGFDLGVGILYGFASDNTTRNLMINSIAPVWDGNETWLVFGIVGLLAAFPLAFSIIIPAIYFPILVMLLALIFRGVAFEFRNRELLQAGIWDYLFYLGSLVATFAQGVILGAYIQGFKVDGRYFIGSTLDCFSWFSLFTGIALIFGYALLGAGWLILKTEGELQKTARRQGRWCFIAVLMAIAVVSLWTPLHNPGIAHRWFDWPNIAYLAPVPIVAAAFAWFEWYGLTHQTEAMPFLAAIGLFSLSYLGMIFSIFPMIVPYHFTLWQAASDTQTQLFLLIGTLFLLPIVLMYTAWSYWVFRGKVRADIGYH